MTFEKILPLFKKGSRIKRKSNISICSLRFYEEIKDEDFFSLEEILADDWEIAHDI